MSSILKVAKLRLKTPPYRKKVKQKTHLPKRLRFGRLKFSPESESKNSTSLPFHSWEYWVQPFINVEKRKEHRSMSKQHQQHYPGPSSTKSTLQWVVRTSSPGHIAYCLLDKTRRRSMGEKAAAASSSQLSPSVWQRWKILHSRRSVLSSILKRTLLFTTSAIIEARPAHYSSLWDQQQWRYENLKCS